MFQIWYSPNPDYTKTGLKIQPQTSKSIIAIGIQQWTQSIIISETLRIILSQLKSKTTFRRRSVRVSTFSRKNHQPRTFLKETRPKNQMDSVICSRLQPICLEMISWSLSAQLRAVDRTILPPRRARQRRHMNSLEAILFSIRFYLEIISKPVIVDLTLWERCTEAVVCQRVCSAVMTIPSSKRVTRGTRRLNSTTLQHQLMLSNRWRRLRRMYNGFSQRAKDWHFSE